MICTCRESDHLFPAADPADGVVEPVGLAALLQRLQTAAEEPGGETLGATEAVQLQVAVERQTVVAHSRQLVERLPVVHAAAVQAHERPLHAASRPQRQPGRLSRLAELAQHRLTAAELIQLHLLTAAELTQLRLLAAAELGQAEQAEHGHGPEERQTDGHRSRQGRRDEVGTGELVRLLVGVCWSESLTSMSDCPVEAVQVLCDAGGGLGQFYTPARSGQLESI